MIAVWEAHAQTETKLHQKYKDKRIRGEWFKLTLKDITITNPFSLIEFIR